MHDPRSGQPRNRSSASTTSDILASIGRRIQLTEEVRIEYQQIWSQLGSRPIEELIDLPLMTDPASLATLDVLTKLVVAGHYVRMLISISWSSAGW